MQEKEKPAILQKKNLSVFLYKNQIITCSLLLSRKTEVYFPNMQVTEETFRKKILDLNPNKLSGPDEVYRRLFIELIDYIS